MGNRHQSGAHYILSLSTVTWISLIQKMFDGFTELVNTIIEYVWN